MAIDCGKVPGFVLSTGEKVPCIGLGTFGSDRVSAQKVADGVRAALKAGFRMIDCAACYGNEKEIGGVLAEVFEEGELKREDLFLMSKVWNDKHREVEKACRQSIADLQCGYLDMYFIHWPFPNYHPPGCDVDSRNPDSRPFSVAEFMDTYRQMEALVDKGLVRNIGLSNMTIPKMEAVKGLFRIQPAACEVELHPCFQQQELFDYLNGLGIQPVGYMPLGSPMRPERDIVATDIADLQLPVMQEIAKAHGIHPTAVALKWAVQRGQIPIPFSTNEAHIRANLEAVMGACEGAVAGAAGTVAGAAFLAEPLTEEEMKKIAALEMDNRLVKGQVFLWEGAEDWHALWDEDGVITDCPDA